MAWTHGTRRLIGTRSGVAPIEGFEAAPRVLAHQARPSMCMAVIVLGLSESHFAFCFCRIFLLVINQRGNLIVVSKEKEPRVPIKAYKVLSPYQMVIRVNRDRSHRQAPTN